MYIALLRGVNINGIRMTNKALKDCFTGLGLTDVKPVLQSGNVKFNSTLAAAELKPIIEQGLRDYFHYDAFIVLTTVKQLQSIVDHFPFTLSDTMQPYIIFTSDTAYAESLKLIPIDEGEALEYPGDSFLYWTVEKGRTLNSAFGKALSHKRYQPFVTTRNLRTIEKLLR